MLKSFVECAAYGVAAILAAVCIFAWAWKWSGWSWSVVSRQLRRSVLAVMVAMAVVATIEAQKRSGNEATGVSLPREDPPVGEAALLPLPATNTLHFSAIAVPTSGTVTLTVAWPENFLTAGQTLDILRKEDLRGETWIWLTNGVVEAGSTNMTWTIENQSPSNSFYKAVVRESLTDMDDPDGDGLPNVYELAHGMNPWLNDYAHVQKLTVGPNGEFGDIFSALAESEEYSIIAVTSGTYQVNGGVQMPPHPVMVTCEDGYAVFSGTSPTAMFLLGNGHDSGHTLFRNLYLNLTSTSGMQAGFWCGGGLPWEAPGASAVFENVHIRAPNPGVEYLGWLFYGYCDAPAVIRRCCVNASGAEWVYAVFGDNPPPIVVESCTFVNFPSQSAYQSAAIGLRSTDANGAITSTPPVMVSRTLFDASFTNAWPLARFENAGGFSVTMTDSILPSEPALPDFMPDVTNDMHIVTSQVAWAGFPLADSPAAALGIGAFAPIPSDSLNDTDYDTLLDYNEVYERGTDPFLVDSDNDGILDDVEIFVDHTDPTNPYSFKQNLTVTVTNKASTVYAVYTAWGISDVGWEANGLTDFPEGFGTTNYVDASSQGATHVKAFCDLNGNGTFDADYDILRVRSIPPGSTARVDFVFGDVDDDGVSDAQERQDGSNPYDGRNFRFAATVSCLSCTTSLWLTNYVAWGYSSAGGEPNGLVSFNGTNYLFAIDEIVTNSIFYVKVFCDLNTNGLYDAEVDALYFRRLTARDNGTAPTFKFDDANNNDLPDWWESREGLAAAGVARRMYDDPDGDGLINLHEYWCGTHPLVPDGSNTLLSVVARSIDDRIRDVDPATSISRFVNYFVNGSNNVFIANANFWARDLDLSCVSVWHSGDCPGSMAATLITRRHVVMARHWYAENYTFCDTNGQVCTRLLLRSSPISDDLFLGQLNAPLPDSFKPASVMSTNYVHYLSTGRYLPTLCLNQEKGATVLELEDLNCRVLENGGPWHSRYGKTSMTNYVSTQRNNIRGATPGGDSGCPVFLVVGNELVLLFSKHLGSKDEDRWCHFWGPTLSFRLEAIQNKINEWEGSGADQYQIVPFDLSVFPEIVNQR